jgi:multicomponent Na+:H+ antiporter subunit G
MEALVSGLLLFGLFFLLTGTLGLLRLRDVYSRMHATSKSTTFGMGGVLLAALLYLRFLGLSSGLKELLILGFLFLTAPVGAHMIARAAYRAGVRLWDGGVVDEFKEWQDKA